MFKNIVCILFFSSLLNTNIFAQIIINEVCSKNNKTLCNSQGDFFDWIEIKNNSQSSVNLSDFYLSDDQEFPHKFRFPNKIIEPSEIIVIFANDEVVNSTNEIYTNFKISSEGETIILSNFLTKQIQILKVPKLLADDSFGCTIESVDSLAFFGQPTPGEENTTQPYQGYAPKPLLNLDPGFYNSYQNLELIGNCQACKTYFTTDGSIPSESSSILNSFIIIDSTISISLINFKEDFLPSELVVETFLFEDHIFPVISISTPPENLWDENIGILTLGPNADTVYPFYGANFWKDTVITIHLEYFDNNKQLCFENYFGLQSHGGRCTRTNPQKAFRITADNKYGCDYIEYPIFGNKVNSPSKSFVLRNSGGDWNKTHFRDGLIHKIVLNDSLFIDALYYQPVCVYLNGNYYGILNLREKISKHYLASNYNIPSENIDLLEEDSIVIEGSFTDFDLMFDFITNNDLSESQNFLIASKMIDIRNVADYFITETFFNNTDWPNNNIKYWKSDDYDAKWRYILFDIDPTLNNYGWANETIDQLGFVMQNYPHNKHVKILKSLLNNQQFKYYFINRYADLINTSFHCDSISREIDELVNYLEPEMSEHFQRWGNNSIATWHKYHIQAANEFAENRPFYARKYIQEQFDAGNQHIISLDVYPQNSGFISINSLQINEFEWNGIYFEDIPITVCAKPANSMKFKYFQLSDGRTYNNDSICINTKSDTNITAIFESNMPNNFSVYPNPIIDKIKIDFLLSESGPFTINILDTSGRKVSSHSLTTNSPGLQSVVLNDLTTLSPGLYCIQLVTLQFISSQNIVKL